MINKNVKYILIITFVLFGIVLSLATSANASSLNEVFDDLDKLIAEAENNKTGENYSVVTNSVSAAANTGGNTAVSGEVVEGGATAEIKSKTIINGETVEDININKESEGDVDMSVKTEVKADEDSVKIETTTEVNGEKNITEKAVPVNNIPNAAKDENNLNSVIIEDEEASEEIFAPVCTGAEEAACGNEDKAPENIDETTNKDTGFFAFLWNSVFSRIKDGMIKIFSFLA